MSMSAKPLPRIARFGHTTSIIRVVLALFLLFQHLLPAHSLALSKNDIPDTEVIGASTRISSCPDSSDPTASTSLPHQNSIGSSNTNRNSIQYNDSDNSEGNFDRNSQSKLKEIVEIRGGVINDINKKSISTIQKFLASPTPKSKSKDKVEEFHIQGWRWHSMSLIRDSERLDRLAKYLLSQKPNNDDGNGDGVDAGFVALKEAADYVVNFNMAGLYRIESTMFVQWLRDHLCDVGRIEAFQVDDAQELSVAFKEVIDKIDGFRIQSEKIGKELYDRAISASKNSKSSQNRQQLLRDITKLSTQLSDRLHAMRNLQETLIVPSVSRLVSSKEQKSFNNRVLINLGLLESRTHLVGMHDTVWASGLESEKKKFETEIPYVARMMIERWRKSLYIPKAGALDFGLDGADS